MVPGRSSVVFGRILELGVDSVCVAEGSKSLAESGGLLVLGELEI